MLDFAVSRTQTSNVLKQTQGQLMKIVESPNIAKLAKPSVQTWHIYEGEGTHSADVIEDELRQPLENVEQAKVFDEWWRREQFVSSYPLVGELDAADACLYIWHLRPDSAQQVLCKFKF